MAKITVARFITEDGGIPQSPNAAYQVLEDGEPKYILTADELDEIVGSTDVMGWLRFRTK